MVNLRSHTCYRRRTLGGGFYRSNSNCNLWHRMQSILLLLILAVAHPAQNFQAVWMMIMMIDDAGAADAATTFDSGLPHFN